jgi:hypothetical protein
LITSSYPTDRVFMWDPDSAVVYALARRLPPIKYVADYHVTDYSSKVEVAKQISTTLPKFIILTSGHPYQELDSLLRDNYLLINQIDNATIYSRLNLTPKTK